MENANNEFQSAQRPVLSISSPAITVLSLIGFLFLAANAISFLRLILSLFIFPGTPVCCFHTVLTHLVLGNWAFSVVN